MLLKGDQGWMWDQEGTMDQKVPGPVAKMIVATQRSPLMCDATQSPLLFLNRDPRMCQESH